MSLEDQLKIKTIMLAIEQILIIRFRPTFLALTYDEECDIIDIVISANSFDYMTISERVVRVFNEILKQMPSVKEDYLIVVQAFTGDEILQVLEGLFPEEYLDEN